MKGSLFKATGVDSTEGAKYVFVWHHAKDSDKYSLLGSGYVSSTEAQLPNEKAGQYSVTFLLPVGCSVNGVVVTNDKDGKTLLPGVKIEPVSGLPPSVAGRSRPVDPAGRTH